MKLFNSFLFAVALSQTMETTTGLSERGRKKNKKPTTPAPTTTQEPTTTTEEPTTTTTTTTTDVTTEGADVTTETTTPYAPPAQFKESETVDYKPDNSNAIVAAILDDVVANRPLRPESDEEAAELARKEALPDFARYCWRCNVGGNFPLTKAGLAEAQNKCVMEGHIDVCYRGNNGCYTETVSVTSCRHPIKSLIQRLSPGKDGETFLTMVDMGCQDYGACKRSQNGMFNYKNPQVHLKCLRLPIKLLLSASPRESNLTARTAARARNNATWRLLLDEDSTRRTSPSGKITSELFNFSDE